MHKTKNNRLPADFTLSLLGEWGGACVKPKQDYPYWKFHYYRGTNLDCEILCEPTSSNNEKKEGNNLSGNPLVNLIFLTTNKEKFSVYRRCAHGKALHMKIEEERDQ